jgi:hypothetical protein
VQSFAHSTVVPVCFLDHVDGFLNMTTPVHEPINDFVDVLRYSTVCFLDHVDGFLNMTTPVHEPIYQVPNRTSPVTFASSQGVF